MKRRSVAIALQTISLSWALSNHLLVEALAAPSTVSPAEATRVEVPSQQQLQPAILVDQPYDSSSSLSSRWSEFVPSMWQEPRGLDSTMHWSLTEETSCEKAASRWCEQVAKGHAERGLLEADLTRSMRDFCEFCQTHLQEPPLGYKARIVCTRGGPASTKCPQWHLDHVPVRWIQSLVGPGCEWVDTEAVRWDRINALDEIEHANVRERNEILVDDDTRLHHQAAQGQAVLALGTKWSKMAKDEFRGVSPCVHKSPTGLQPWEGRVLLTMDVLVEEYD